MFARLSPSQYLPVQPDDYSGMHMRPLRLLQRPTRISKVRELGLRAGEAGWILLRPLHKESNATAIQDWIWGVDGPRKC